MDEFKTTFGQRLKQLREEKHISQAQLAKLLNVGTATICYWETEQTHPVDFHIVRVAKFFQVSTDYLLGLIENNF